MNSIQIYSMTKAVSHALQSNIRHSHAIDNAFFFNWINLDMISVQSERQENVGYLESAAASGRLETTPIRAMERVSHPE